MNTPALAAANAGLRRVGPGRDLGSEKSMREK
jgi:hypothetical protein